MLWHHACYDVEVFGAAPLEELPFDLLADFR
jgi:hypothetical protein